MRRTSQRRQCAAGLPMMEEAPAASRRQRPKKKRGASHHNCGNDSAGGNDGEGRGGCQELENWKLPRRRSPQRQPPRQGGWCLSLTIPSAASQNA